MAQAEQIETFEFRVNPAKVTSLFFDSLNVPISPTATSLALNADGLPWTKVLATDYSFTTKGPGKAEMAELVGYIKECSKRGIRPASMDSLGCRGGYFYHSTTRERYQQPTRLPYGLPRSSQEMILLLQLSKARPHRIIVEFEEGVGEGIRAFMRRFMPGLSNEGFVGETVAHSFGKHKPKSRFTSCATSNMDESYVELQLGEGRPATNGVLRKWYQQLQEKYSIPTETSKATA